MGLLKELLNMAKATKKTAKKAAKKSTKKKTTVKKKTVAKKAAKKTAKKVAAKKTAKKATAKKVAKKAPAKKATAKKTAKKIAAKKKTAKKVAAKKKTAKKVAAKKTAKKVAAKKAAASKTAAKVATKSAAAKETAKKSSSNTEEKVQAKKKQAAAKTAEIPTVMDDEKIEDEVDVDDFEMEPAPKSEKLSRNKDILELEGKINDEVVALSENFSWEEIADAIGSLDFFVDHRSDECLEKGCDNLRTTQQYCRLHYFANWYDIKKKREILKEGKLQEYIEELISKYPPTLIESIVQDLADEKDFYRALHELNITSDFDLDDETFEGADDEDDDTDDIAVETRNFASHRFEDDQ